MSHEGFVKSRTADASLVAEPITIIIQGRKITLSIADAAALCNGLVQAINRVSENETVKQEVDFAWNVAVSVKPRAVMSLPPTKNENLKQEVDFVWNVTVSAKPGSGMSFPPSKLGFVRPEL